MSLFQKATTTYPVHRYNMLGTTKAVQNSDLATTTSEDNAVGCSSKITPIVRVRCLEKGESLANCAVIIILVVTGAGKSSLIEKLGSRTPANSRVVGISEATLDSGTLDVVGYRMDHRYLNIFTAKPIVLVDTPGLNDKDKSEMATLSDIKKWMKKSGVKNVDRLFYMARISDNRVPCSKAKSLEIFKELCGPQAANRTVVATTHWNEMRHKESLRAQADRRFKLLKDQHWKDFLDQGSRMETFDNTFEAALRCVQALGQPFKVTGQAFAFKEDNALSNETDVGRKVFQALVERYENLLDALEVIEKGIKGSEGINNVELDKSLLKQKTQILENINAAANHLSDYSAELAPFKDSVQKALDFHGSAHSATTTSTNATTVHGRSGLKAKAQYFEDRAWTCRTGDSRDWADRNTVAPIFTNLWGLLSAVMRNPNDVFVKVDVKITKSSY